MQMLSFEPIAPFVIGNQSRFHITIVGAGGTGSYIVQTVARLMAHANEKGSPKIDVTLVDGDTIEAKNIGRQLFAPAEIGRNKAQSLATRFNQALGLKIQAIPTMIDQYSLPHVDRYQWHQSAALDKRPYSIVVGAVDNAEARKVIHDGLAKYVFNLWIDSGNHEHGDKCL